MFKITQIREAKRMNKSELGWRSGVAISDICRLENGEIFPSPPVQANFFYHPEAVYFKTGMKT